MSDTHQDMKNSRLAVTCMGSVDLLLHAGDHYSDALVLAKELNLEVKAVTGNCDFADEILEQVFELKGKKFLLTHGHLYGVKTGYQRLYYRAKELKVDVVVFGHTHIPENRVVDDILLVNPGSISRPRVTREGTFGIMEYKGREWAVHIKKLSRKE
nr:metallophosphoesterase [Calderihabitans maritimus]